MPLDYDDAVKDRQRKTEEEDEHKEGLPNHAPESGSKFEGEEIEKLAEQFGSIMVNPPGYLSKAGVQEQREQSRRPTQTSPTGESIEITAADLGLENVLLGGLAGELGDLSFGELGSLGDIDFDQLNTRDLLQIQVQTLVEMLSVTRLNARSTVASLSALYDIADAVEPFKRITVSGSNDIELAESPEPVVPESDDANIPTRRLFIKADSDNQTQMAFGDDEITPENGFILNPGESIVWPSDIRGDELYMTASKPGQTVHILGVF